MFSALDKVLNAFWMSLGFYFPEALSLSHHHTQHLLGGAGGLSLLESFQARLGNEVILKHCAQLLVSRVLAVSIATALARWRVTEVLLGSGGGVQASA